jgi:hypothetical protein
VREEREKDWWDKKKYFIDMSVGIDIIVEDNNK